MIAVAKAVQYMHDTMIQGVGKRKTTENGGIEAILYISSRYRMI